MEYPGTSANTIIKITKSLSWLTTDEEKSAEPNAAVIKIIVNDYKKPSRCAAIIRQGGKIKEWFEIADTEIRNCVDTSEETGQAKTNFDEKTKIFTVKTSGHPTYNVVVNFENKTAEAWFSDIKEEYLEPTEFATSDGKYSLYEGAPYGGGDVVFWPLFVKNNRTGEIHYFRDIGGMYGGYNFYGFLKNGDLYYMDGETLKIYNPETLEMTFDLSKNFCLGYNEEEKTKRLLFTFRRDPEKLDFIAVYCDIPDDGGLGWGGSESEKFTYRIALLDSDGSLLESYDTGKHIQYGKFTVSEVSLKLDGEKLYMYFGSSGGSDRAFGIFNMKTHEYKDN